MPAVRSVVAAAVVVAAAGCTTGGVLLAGGHHPVPAPAGPAASPTGTPSPSPPRSATPTVTVDGLGVPAGRAVTVAAALAAAGVRVPPGQMLAVVSRRPLGSDGHRGHVLVNGAAATLATALAAGDRVAVVAGVDEVEGTRLRTVTLPAPNPSNLYVGGAPGRGVQRVGVRSGEVASTRVLVAPQLGHLLSPGAVALTFDDGPDPTYTPQVLALLVKAHVHATFCLIGRNAARYPQLVREIVAGGHTLCDHTWDHDEQLRVRPAGQISLDIARGADAIRKAAGVAPALFRAPGGNWSPAIEAAARAQHMTPLKWTVDPRDWSRPGVNAILSTVYAELRPGGVILCHDGGGNRSQTVAALKILLTRLPAMGYHFVVPPAQS